MSGSGVETSGAHTLGDVARYPVGLSDHLADDIGRPLGKLEPRRVDHQLLFPRKAADKVRPTTNAPPPHQAARFEARSAISKGATTERVNAKCKKAGGENLGLKGQRLQLKGIDSNEKTL